MDQAARALKPISTWRAGAGGSIARLPPRTIGRAGDEMDVSFDLAKLHFFDTLTEQAIPH